MTPTSEQAPVAEKPTLVQPEERFWKRYSPNHEFPLSSFASLTLYCLLAIIVAVVIKYKLLDVFGNKETLPIEPITLVGTGEGGGGTNGSGNTPPRENIPDTEAGLPEHLKPKVPLTKLPRPEVKPALVKEFDPADEGAMVFIRERNFAVVALADVQEEARRKLMEGLRSSGTPGKDGGQDGGKDSGKDGGVGPNKNGKPLTTRQQRAMRWVIHFDWTNGNDYARQLSAVGAILAVPGPDGSYQVIRDLSARPATGAVEDLTRIKRVFCVDSQPGSVKSLATALQLPAVPEHIVVFFSEKQEAELLRKELKFKGRKEHEILETRFQVIRRGNSFEPVVVDQRLKK
jgi:hypothetical protein